MFCDSFRLRRIVIEIISTMNEDIVVVPWVGPMSCTNALTVIVLSQNVEIIEKIANALTEVHSKGSFRWKLIVLQSLYLDEVERQSDLTGRIAIDFVIVAIDTTRMFCLEWAKNQVKQVHLDLRSRRVIVVNAGGLPMSSMALDIGELVTFQNDNKLDMLTADVMKTDDALFLAQKLIRYLEVSVGVKTGFPNLNI